MRALGRQQRVAAHHEALAGVRLGADLHQVDFVEQGRLHRPGVHQLAERRGAQGADPIETRGFDLLADARFGQHAPVADQHHPRQPEAAAQLVDLCAHGRRVGGVAVEHLDRHRTALAVAQQAKLDLQLAALGVARVAALGQRTAAPLQVAGGQVVEHQGAFGQVPLGQAVLDPLLALT